jgi:hypothetical protein
MANSTETRNRRSVEKDGRPDGDEQREEPQRGATEESSDEQPSAEERREEGQGGDEGGSGGDQAESRLSAKELTEAAVSTIADLTGFEPESAAGLQWDGESWLVTVDVLELARIPNTTDVLASYVVQLDDRGGLLGYKRVRRFVRGQVEGE